MTPTPRLALAAAAVLALSATASAAPPVIDAQRGAIREIEADVLALEGRAATAAGRERAALHEVAALEARMRRNARALAAARRDQRRAQGVLARRIVDIYRQGEPDSVLEVLVSRGSIAEAASQVALLDRVARQDGDAVVEVGALRSRIAGIRVQLVTDRGAARAAARRAAAERARVAALGARRRAALDRARAVLRDLEAREARRRAAEAARRRAAARAARAARRARAAAARAQATPPPAPSPSPSPSPAPPAPPAAPGGGFPPVPGGPSADVLDRIARCESGGDPRSVSSNGMFRGKYQFMPSTWASVGGSGDPAAAPEAEQDYRASLLFVRDGPGQWPVCAAFVPR